jgi:hypothetical protein
MDNKDRESKVAKVMSGTREDAEALVRMPRDEFLAHLPKKWPDGVPLPEAVVLPGKLGDDVWAPWLYAGFVFAKDVHLTDEQRAIMYDFLLKLDSPGSTRAQDE